MNPPIILKKNSTPGNHSGVKKDIDVCYNACHYTYFHIHVPFGNHSESLEIHILLNGIQEMLVYDSMFLCKSSKSIGDSYTF